jgi:hypothetical protein
MTQIEEMIKQETALLIAQLEDQINDPQQKLAIAEMSADLAMLPVRMARGEDVTLLAKSLQAEAALRGVTTSLKAQATVQQAWINIVVKIIAAALTA